MKNNSFIFAIGLLLSLVLSSCAKENDWEDWKIMNEQWLEQHRSDEGFITTESGLSYKIIHAGYQKNPTSQSAVAVSYTGKLINGTVFDSSTGYYINDLSSYIQGFSEGLPKIKESGIIQLYIPYNLGYGEDGSGNSIPPYSTLIFEVQLLKSYN